MRIIDAHNHLLTEPGFLDSMLRTMDACGIEKIGLSGLGPVFDGFATNAEVKAAFDAHPDRVIGQVFVRPGVDDPNLVCWGYNEGFKMVKVTAPTASYDDQRFYPIWERALECRMPILFHTGIIAPFVEGRGMGISSYFMQPMQVEHITREFPELPVIVAHLGVNWNVDAAELARMRPNLYVDLTGAPGGWRERMDIVGLENLLWWPGAFEKVIFGTDVHFDQVKAVLDQDIARYDRIEVDEATRRLIFADTILRLIGEEES